METVQTKYGVYTIWKVNDAYNISDVYSDNIGMIPIDSDNIKGDMLDIIDEYESHKYSVLDEIANIYDIFEGSLGGDSK